MQNDLSGAVWQALLLIARLDGNLIEIVALSLRVSLTAVLVAALLGMPLAACLALFRFPGRKALALMVNAGMGLPPVVVGLIVYLMLSRSGPLGTFGLLYSPAAMIIAQTILILPVISAPARQTIADLWTEYDEQMRSMDIGGVSLIGTMLWEARFSLATALLAGFGRASAEVGAVMIVGGNIDHATRVMTTAIALETSKGNLSLALGLGLILLLLSLSVNLAVHLLGLWAPRYGAARPA
ncbi:MAG: ABC transporter permease [Hyphomicrobiales bacterium]|nr:MAG: ABC transporter permease [Hyphomicrobiales bacterium]